MKHIAALFLALMMTLSAALAELRWPDLNTDGQRAMKTFVEAVNANLAAQGLPGINSAFECYPGFATMGITMQDNAEIAEDVELTFTLEENRMASLQVRVCTIDRFAAITGACLQAAAPGTALSEAMVEPAQYVQRAVASPYTAFEDAVDLTPSAALRRYWAYYPDQYSDGRSWLQLTLVFPLSGSDNAIVALTPVPDAPPSEEDEMYGSNTFYDEDYQKFSHLDVVLTPTPEPDSAAMD